MVVEILGFVDGLHCVELILHLSLIISSQLFLFPLLLGAVDGAGGDDGNGGDDHAEGGDQGHVAAGVLLPDGGVNQAKFVVLGVNFARWKNLTNCAGVLGQTDTGEGVVAVLAEASIETRTWITLVDFLRTVFASVSRSAGAVEVIDSILAGSSIGTRIVLAVIVVVLAIATNESILTNTLVVVDEWETYSVVLARRVFAQISHFFTVSPLEAWGTSTGIAGHVGHASGSVFTGVVFCTNIKIRSKFTMRSVESRCASAGIIIVQTRLKQSKNS